MNDTPPDALPPHALPPDSPTPDDPPPDAPSAGDPPRDPGTANGPPSDEPSIWDVPDRWHAPADWDASSHLPGTTPAATPAAIQAAAPPDGPPATNRRRRLLIVLAVVAVLMAGAVAATALAVTRGDSLAADPSRSGAGQGSGSSTTAPRPTATPSEDGDVPSSSPAPSQSAAGGGLSDAAVPILMYHLIAPPPAESDYPGLYVRPATFARQMEYLREQGYEAVSLARVFDAWDGKATLPDKPVVLSFDDGYPSHYLVAAPIMEQYGWKGLLNADWKVLDESPRLLAQVRLLAEAGWEMGSHTLSHPDLTTLDDAQLEEEVAGSRAMLRKQLDVPIEFFCYPAGRYDDGVVAAVEAAGYRGATTTDRGLATRDDPYRLRRIRVDDTLSGAGLAAAMKAASD